MREITIRLSHSLTGKLSKHSNAIRDALTDVLLNHEEPGDETYYLYDAMGAPLSDIAADHCAIEIVVTEDAEVSQ